jgi:TP901 family phage tail tape measure protein
MAGNKNFSQTIQYKGQLDVSQIISSLQKIRNELANSSTLKGKDSLFINVDKEMKNIENLSTQLKAAIQRGFSNPKDVKDFERIVNSLDKSFNKVAVDLNGINANKLTQELRNATDELAQQKRALNDIIASEKNNISLQMQSIKHGKTYANTLVQSAKSGEKLEEVQKRITNEIDQQIEKQKQLKAQAEQKVNTATTQLNIAKTNAYKTSFRQSSFKTIDESGKKTSTTISDEQYSKVNQIFKEVVSNEKTAEKAIEKFNKELQKLGISASKAAINNVSKSFNEIQTSVKPAEAALKTAEAELQKVKKALDQMTQQKGTVGSAINSQEIVSSYQKIVAAVNSVAQAENNVNAARGKMGSQIPEMQRYATLMNQYKGATQQATQQVGELTEQQQRFDSTFDHLTRYIQYTFSLANGFRMLRQVIQKTFNDVKELDAAFASIAMVTDYSVEQMWSSYDDYAEMANRLGQTTKDVIASSALFYQQGLDTAEALELTESTMKLATLAGSDFETATSQMTAALRGFNMEMDEGERITDVYSELAAKAAADVDGIAYAMSKTASIAASAGMEFETTSAFLTQMIETTQEAPENIGTAMKTIIARFTELKENVAGTADSEFEDLDYNKVDTALKSVGVSLKDANGQFRDLDDVFLELAEKWDTLDRNSQRYIATIAAGSRQQSRFIAMMEDYDRTVELIDTAYDSAGRSSEQFAKYQDTVEYKLKQLSNTWEQLRTGFLDSDAYKGVIDFANKALNLVGNMDLKQILTVGTIGLTLGKTIITQFVDGIKGNIGILKASWNNSIEQIFDVDGKGFNRIKASFKKFASLTNFKNNVYGMTAKIDANQFLSGANEILGGKIANSPELTNKVEIQKTAQLQEQLSLYTQLEQKRQSIAAQAKQELATGNGITQQTREQSNAVYQEVQEKNKYINNLLKELGYEKEITAENAKQIAQALQENAQAATKKHSVIGQAGISSLESGLSAGITSALMMAISGADLATVIKTASISALAAAIPPLISAIMPTIVSVLTGPVGLTVALTAVIIGVIVAVDKEAKEARKAELERLSKIKDANKELQKENDDIINSYKKATKEEEKFKKAVEDVQKLQNKKFLTESEQTTLDEAASYLKENYEEVIEEDELTGHFTIIETKLSEIEENTKRDEQEDVANIYKNISAQFKNAGDRAEERERLIFSMQESNFTGVEGNVDYDIGNKLVETSEYGNIVYANVSTAFEQVKDELSDLKTIYGEELDLNTIFGMSNFEDLLNSDLSTFEIKEQLEENHITTQDIEEKISDISKELTDIDKHQIEADKRAATEDSLLLQGWDETAAEIASYASKDFEIGTNTEIQNEIKKDINKAGGNKDFLNGIAAGNLQTVFGKDYKKYEDAFKMLGYGEGEDKSLSDLFSSGTNLEEWNNLSEEMRDAILDLTEEDSKTWDEDGWFGVANRTESKITTDVLMKVLSAQMIEASEIWTEENQQLLEDNKENFANLSQHMLDSSDKTWKEYQTDVDRIINTQTDEEVKNAMIEYRDTAEDSIYRQWNGYIEQLKNIGGTNKGIDDEIVNKLDFSSIQYFTEQLSSLDLSQYGYEKIANYINTNFGNLNENALNILANIPIEELSSLTLSSSQEYIEKLTEATNDASLAQQIFYDYVEQMKSVTRSGVFVGKDSTQILKKQYQEELKGFNEKYSSIFKANEEMLENQALSSETYFQLIEEGFEEYVDITSDGYTLIQDKAEEAWTQMALSPLKDLRAKISEQDAFLKEAQSYVEKENETFEISAKQVESFGLEDSDVISNNGESAVVSLNKLISAYVKLREEEEDTSEIEAIFGDKIDFINKMVNEGYTSLISYAQALKNGKIALSEMEPDVWVQGLVSISEAVADADEKIEDLNEELEDLNKQLEEDKAALAEAEDELRQAIHGSDDFQSSLDGLVNYTEKIERLDKAIEKTKEALEDVSDVDEAKGLMAQLNEQYDNKTISLGAENMAIDAALENLRSTLTENYGDYISFDEEGNPLIDFAYMTMDANDEIRKAFEEEYNLYNEYRDKQIDNLDAIAEIEKAKQEQKEQSLKNFVSIQEDVISILKEKAQEEIDVTKEKYDALEEADNDYLDALQDAIDKQRELRDKQNQYEDLATKEKKLSLLQRDTSGANQKEVLTLQNEIEDDRQNLLDSEIDSMIESMKELYEKQKEARDAEIEYMEEVTEDTQYFAEWAANIMSTWKSAEDMQAWYLENDPNAQDMTVEQTEVYLNEIGDKYSDYVQYIATLATDFTTEQEELNAAINEMYENTSTNVENIGTVTQDLAQAAADKAIEEATKARDDAKDKLEETQKKIDETTEKLKAAEDTAVQKHSAAMDAMVEASQSSMSQVSTFATKQLAEMLGYDLSKEEDIEKFAKEFNFMNDKGEITQNLYNAINDNGGEASKYKTASAKYEVFSVSSSGNKTSFGFFDTKEAADAVYNQKIKEGANKDELYVSDSGNKVVGTFKETKTKKHGILWPDDKVQYTDSVEEAQQTVARILNSTPSNAADGQYKNWAYKNNYEIFKTGGLVNYTGPAWVDGTPTKPEAFLNAEDTERIGNAAKILADIPLLNSTSLSENAISSNIGDTTIEIHINVESIESDYDVDQMIERVKNDILDVSKPTGTSVILKK